MWAGVVRLSQNANNAGKNQAMPWDRVRHRERARLLACLPRICATPPLSVQRYSLEEGFRSRR